jgi:hypothetical protein
MIETAVAARKIDFISMSFNTTTCAKRYALAKKQVTGQQCARHRGLLHTDLTGSSPPQDPRERTHAIGGYSTGLSLDVQTPAQPGAMNSCESGYRCAPRSGIGCDVAAGFFDLADRVGFAVAGTATCSIWVSRPPRN